METGRIMAIDYGKKRVGLAVTDPLQMIATRLETIQSGDIWKYLDNYFKKEKVVLVLVGYPLQMNNEPSRAVTYINPFLKAFVRKYPEMPVQQVDERFTSKLAFQAMIDGGLKKMERQDKALVDGVSATILLQSYLEQNKYLK
jgi:putative Holliday junction resolvase